MSWTLQNACKGSLRFFSLVLVSTFHEVFLPGSSDRGKQRRTTKSLPPLQGNYPYPSSYILNGVGVLPAFPMRVACESLAAEHMDETALLEGLATAAGVFYNFSHDISCFNYRRAAKCVPCLVHHLLYCALNFLGQSARAGLHWLVEVKEKL